MFFTFLNKTQVSYADISLITAYNPEQVMEYFYSESLYINLNTYLSLIKMCGEDEDTPEIISNWLDFIGVELEAFADLALLQENDFLGTIGPYYYPATNSRIYFTKDIPIPDQFLNTEDFAILENLQQLKPVNPLLQKYIKPKKNGNKKSSRSKEDVLTELTICNIALSEIELLDKQANFLQKFIEKRATLLASENLQPAEPDNFPVKPMNPEESKNSKRSSNLIPFLRNSKKKTLEKQHNNYNHDLKIYYIRYREYEKACDRYKNSLAVWSTLKPGFLALCQKDIKKASDKLSAVQRTLKIYNTILQKSIFHDKYQNLETLKIFKDYLETGRAADVQECMNLFEEERLWNELKAGQERIENTIYFIQNDNAHVHKAQKHIDRFIADKKLKENNTKTH